MTRKNRPAKFNDDLDGIAESFMNFLHKEFRGKKAEISAHMLTKMAKRFAAHYHYSDAVIMDCVLRRQWIIPDAGNTYHIDYQKVRK